jgi:predicted GH43/DUF377 family glycosyl hydrolase
MHGGNAVLMPDASRSWESRVVLNPAAVLVEANGGFGGLCESWGLTTLQAGRLRAEGGACVMLYRAQGEIDAAKGAAPSSVGLAVFTPHLDLVSRLPDPVLRPDEPFQNLGVEDARCTRVDDVYYLYYTGYGRAAAVSNAYAGDGAGEGRVRICLATSRDLRHWDVRGPLTGELNDVPNKNAALQPRPVDGKWLLLHRPMEGPDAMTIHLAESDAPDGPWRSRGMLMRSYPYKEFSKSWIGAGGPPIAIGAGRFLMIYHQGHFTPEGGREYDVAAALLDFSFDYPVRSRIEPLMRPEGEREQTGEPDLGVDNVLFTCANYRLGDELIIPYAGADSRIFGATISTSELVAALENLSRL